MLHSVFLLSTLLAPTLAALTDGGPGTICNGGGLPNIMGCPPGTVLTDDDGNCCDPLQVIPNPDLTTHATTLAPGATVATTLPTNIIVTGFTIAGNTVGNGVAGSCIDLVNPQTGVSDCSARASLCNDATYYNVMSAQCPKTCNRCSSASITSGVGNCVDKVNPQTGTSDCSARASLCNDATYQKIMTEQCPKTCGRCSGVGSSTVAGIIGGTTGCADLANPATGVSECSSKRDLCNNPAYATLMAQQCPLTCGKCSGTGSLRATISTGTIGIGATGCVDQVNLATGVSDCPSRAFLCNNAAYATLMTQQCPKTCGKCSGIGGATVATTSSAGTGACVDQINPNTGTSDCPSVAFQCNDPIFAELMAQQCPKTCGKCSSSSSTTGTIGVTVSSSSGTCADLINQATGVSDCPARKNLCNNPIYLSLMKVQCPMTCGLCSG